MLSRMSAAAVLTVTGVVVAIGVSGSAGFDAIGLQTKDGASEMVVSYVRYGSDPNNGKPRHKVALITAGKLGQPGVRQPRTPHQVPPPPAPGCAVVAEPILRRGNEFDVVEWFDDRSPDSSSIQNLQHTIHSKTDGSGQRLGNTWTGGSLSTGGTGETVFNSTRRLVQRPVIVPLRRRRPVQPDGVDRLGAGLGVGPGWVEPGASGIDGADRAVGPRRLPGPAPKRTVERAGLREAKAIGQAGHRLVAFGQADDRRIPLDRFLDPSHRCALLTQAPAQGLRAHRHAAGKLLLAGPIAGQATEQHPPHPILDRRSKVAAGQPHLRAVGEESPFTKASSNRSWSAPNRSGAPKTSSRLEAPTGASWGSSMRLASILRRTSQLEKRCRKDNNSSDGNGSSKRAARRSNDTRAVSPSTSTDMSGTEARRRPNSQYLSRAAARSVPSRNSMMMARKLPSS